jgi:L-fuconate dehydratase
VTRITGLETYDVRFPTSRALDGSDAMNPAPDYSAAYLVLRTDDPGLSGHGFVFTIGEGNDVQAAALRALEPHVVGQDVGELAADPGLLSRRLVADSPLRWLGPEKGVMHMAIGAVVNAGWDLVTRTAGEPLWRYLARLSPEQVVGLVDFRYLSDALTPDEALAILREAEAGKEDRIAELEHHGYPAYSTSPGWLGYSADKLATLLREAADDGFTQVKLKVGADRAADIARLKLAREVVGDEMRIAVDANQVWDVPEAISWINELAPFGLAWIEEPTSPDDVLGLAAIRRSVAPVPVATGEHVANRVIFKQLLQAEAVDVMQIDACRVGGVNENIANLLLAAKFGVRVCPHAGGVGLCEAVQHLSFFDYAAVSRSLDGRSIEWIDHLHEHFTSPASVVRGRYTAPLAPGNSMEIKPSSVREYLYPSGSAWAQASA